MIVIGIIALLAGLVINKYVHSLEAGEVVTSQAQMKQIANALNAYRIDKHAYPAGNGVNVDTSLFGASGNNYMTGAPLDNATPYNYFVAWNNEGYLIRGNYRYDGALLGNMKDIYGATVVPGSSYLLAYTPIRGLVAWGPY